MTRSFAQERAEHALAGIKALESTAASAQGGAKAAYGNYVSYAKALPATIITNGLGQALAMEKAGSAKLVGHRWLFRHMRSWLCAGWKRTPFPVPEAADDKAFFDAIITGTETDYIRCQAEALEYLEWLKKFAVAFLVEPDDAEIEGEDS